MRGAGLLAVTGLLSCYRPDAEVGAPCSPAGDCPSGQQCDMQMVPPTCVTTLPGVDAGRDAAVDASGSDGSGSGSGGGAPELSISVKLLGTGNVDLTAEGTADWVHWGLGSATAVDRKLGGAGIGDLASPPQIAGSGFPFTASWSDGTPDASATTSTGIGDLAAGASMQFSAAAGTTAHVLRFYALVEFTSAQLSAVLSDDSATAAPITEDAGSGTDPAIFAEFEITYRAASAGQSLTVTWAGTGSATEAAIGAMNATLQ